MGPVSLPAPPNRALTPPPSEPPHTLWHTQIQMTQQKRIPAPAGHPAVNSLVIQLAGGDFHDNMDGPNGMIFDPERLESDHPDLDRFFLIGAAPAGLPIAVWSGHPDADRAYARGEAISASHPSVAAMLPAGAIPDSHPDVDMMLRDPTRYPMPSWHPTLESLLSHRADAGTISAWSGHPDADKAYQAGEAVPATHPPIATMFPAGSLPLSHPDVVRHRAACVTRASRPRSVAFGDAPPPPSPHFFSLPHPPIFTATHLDAGPLPIVARPLAQDFLLRNPGSNPLPSWHLSLESMIKRRKGISVAYNHPGTLDELYADGSAMPDRHPPVHPLLSVALPEGHSNLDVILKAPDKYPLPAGHPPLERMVTRRTIWSPGLLFSIAVIGSFVVVWLVQTALRCLTCASAVRHGDGKVGDTVARPACSTASDPPTAETAVDMDLPGTTAVPEASPAKAPSGAKAGLPTHRAARLPAEGISDNDRPLDINQEAGRPPHRRLGQYRASVRHRSHLGDEAEPIYDNVFEPPRAGTIRRIEMGEWGDEPFATGPLDGMANTWVQRWWSGLTTKRIPGSQWTSGAVMFCSLYLAGNLAAAVVSHLLDDYTFGRGFGSLAAANTMLLIIPATRNNILTWGMGLAFDHIVLYHRFLGRVTILVAVIHGAMYIEQFVADGGNYVDYTDYVNWMGTGALICGLLIVVTTFDRVRRRFFNVFFYAHYSFIGFFVLAYLHAENGRPFLIAGIAAYGLDKALRFLWTLWPRHTIVFRNRGENIAQVVLPKNAVANWLGRYKVGQYMFVNFPELSLHEWHPFSVSSGPWESHLELHIRALGDHTRDIVDLSKRCAAVGRQVWIRSDGPYGVHNFNYRRYGVLVLVGGGVGVTPVISILKDLYGGYGAEGPRGPVGNAPAHRIRRVYAVWVLPRAADTATFYDVLEGLARVAQQHRNLPELVLRIHCTREVKGSVDAPYLLAGRPDLPGLLEETSHANPGESTVVFACGPGRMVNTLWDEAVRRNSQQQRVDFHHETFEF